MTAPSASAARATTSTGAAAASTSTFDADHFSVVALTRQHTIQCSANESGYRQRGDCRLGEPTARDWLMFRVRVLDLGHEVFVSFHSVSSVSPGE